MDTQDTWDDTIEPPAFTGDPQTIVDSNIEGQVWMYNINNESTENLVYHGEPAAVRR